MTDPLAKAYINLYGVLRSLTYLCEMDRVAGDIIRNADITVQFSIKSGPAARLIFSGGKCSFEEGKGKSGIKLCFASPEKFNKMIEGKGNPVIEKGLTKIGFLKKEFTGLTKRLEYYLKPGPDTAQDDSYKKISTLLTFFTAFHALPGIGMYDPVGCKVMQKAVDGQMCVSIEKTGYNVRLRVSKGNIGVMQQSDGSPEVHMIFADIEKTGDVLNGKTDFLTAIGNGAVKMKGYMPIMMSVEHLVPRLAVYLK